MNEVTTFRQESELGEVLTKRNDVGAQTIAQTEVNQKLEGRQTRNLVADDISNNISQYGRDISIDGTVPSEPIAEQLREYNQLDQKADTPEERQINAGRMSNLLDEVGVPNIVADLDRREAEGEDVTNDRDALSMATAISGDPNKFTADQKVIVGSGLNAEHVKRPRETIDKVAQLVSGNTANLDDPDLKAVLRDNDFVIAARKASKNGTQSFTMQTDILPTGGQGGVDVEGGEAVSQKVTSFIGADGTTFNVRAPQTPQDSSVLSMMDKVQLVNNERAGVSRNAQEQIGQIQGRTQQQAQQAQEAQAVSEVARPNIRREGGKIINDELGITLSETPPTRAQVAREAAARAFDEGLDAKDSREAARKDLDDFDAQVKPIRQEIRDSQKAIRQNEQFNRDTTAFITKLQATGNADLLGKGGTLPRLKNSVQEILGLGTLSSSERRLLVDQIDRLGAQGMIGTIREVGTTAANSAKEQQFFRQGTISENSELGNIINFNIAKLAETEKSKNINTLKNRLLTEGPNVGVGLTELTVDEYLNSPASDPIMFNASKYDLTSDPANPTIVPGREDEPDLIANPNFQTAEEFLGIKERRTSVPAAAPVPIEDGQDLLDTRAEEVQADIAGPTAPPSAPIPGGTPPGPGEAQSSFLDRLLPGVSEAQAQEVDTLAPEPTAPVEVPTEAPTGQAESTVGQLPDSPFFNFFKDTVDETTGEIEKGFVSKAGDFVNHISESVKQGRIDEKEKLLQTRQQQDPSFREVVEAEKAKITENEDLFREQPGIIDDAIEAITPDFVQEIANSVSKFPDRVIKAIVPDFVEDFAQTAREKTIDLVFVEFMRIAQGDEAANKAQQELKATREARQEVVEDKRLEDPAQEMLASGIAFGLLGGAIKKGAVGGLSKIAENSPVAARALNLVTGGKFSTPALEASGKAIAPVTGRVARTAVAGGGIAGEAAVDAASFALVEADSVEEAIESADDVFLLSAALQTAFKAVPGVANEVERIFRKSSQLTNVPNKARLIADDLADIGVTKESIQEAVEGVRALPGGEVSAVGALSPRSQGLVSTLAQQPGGRDVAARVAPRLQAQRQAATAANQKLAGLSDVRNINEVTQTFDDVITSTIESRAAQATAEQTVLKNQSIQNILKDSIGKTPPKAQQNIAKITKELNKKSKDLDELVTKGAGGTDIEAVTATRIKDLEAVRGVVDDSLSPVFKKLETQFQNLDEGITNGVITNLQNRFGQKARGAVEEVSSQLEGVTGASRNSLKFMTELRELISKGGTTKTNIGQSAKSSMLKILDKGIDDALENAGASPKAWSQFIGRYGALSKIGQGLDKQISVLKEVENGLLTGSSGLQKKIFSSGAERQNIADALGKQEAVTLESNLKAVDSAIDKLQKIEAGGRQPDLVGLSDDIVTALKFVGPEKNFVKSIIKSNPRVIENVTKSLGKDKELVQAGTMSFLKESFEEASSKINISKGKLRASELVGLKPKEWENVKTILGKESGDKLDNFLNRQVAIDKGSALFSETSNILQEKFGIPGNIALRRLEETRLAFGLDIISSAIQKKVNRKKTFAIIEGLTDPDPKKVNDLILEAAELITISKNNLGSEAKLLTRDIPQESIDFVRRAVVGGLLAKSEIREEQRGKLSAKAQKQIEAMNEVLSQLDSLN